MSRVVMASASWPSKALGDVREHPLVFPQGGWSEPLEFPKPVCAELSHAGAEGALRDRAALGHLIEETSRALVMGVELLGGLDAARG